MKRTTIWISEELHGQVKDACHDAGISVSRVITSLLKAWVVKAHLADKGSVEIGGGEDETETCVE
jgi:hypothetical protein